MGGDAPYVGRAVERGVARAAVDALAAGRGGVLVVQGEAGIGKSRLVDEALAGARGLQLLRGRARELERTRPLGPLAEALRPTGWTPGDDGGYRAVESLLAAVERTALAGPLALVAEDLHWADPLTLQALHAVATRLRHLPVLLLATVRPAVPGGEVDRLVRGLVDAGAAHLVLAGLDGPEAEALAAAAAGAPPGPSLAALLRRARGNPLFVTELVRALAQDGVLTVRGGLVEVTGAGLPPSLRLVLLRRLSELPPPTLDLLRVAAVLGAAFDVAQLGTVTGRPAVALLPELQEALRAGVLGEAGDRLAFRHDLLWEALYQDLAPALRRALHRDAGRALAAAGAPAAQVAEHLAAGASPGDLEAVTWLAGAAAQTLRVAPAAAADLLERALALAGRGFPDRDALRAELVVAQVWAGRTREAEALARDVLSRRHDAALDGQVQLHLVEALAHQDRPHEAAAEGRAALARPDLPGHLRARLQAETAFNLLATGDAAAARAAAGSALALGRRLDDDQATCSALDVLALDAMYRGDVGRGVDLARAAAVRGDAARARPGPPVPGQGLAIGHFLLATALLAADDPDAAAAAVATGRQVHEEVGNLLDLPLHQFLLAVLRWRTGQWDDALAEAEAGLDLAADLQTRRGAVAAHAVTALVAVHRNDLAAAEAALARGDRELAVAAAQPWAHHLGWAAALVLEARGRTGAAIAALERAWDGLGRAGVEVERPHLGPDLVRLLVATGRGDRAREVTAAVAAVAARAGTPSARAAALRCRALTGSPADPADPAGGPGSAAAGREAADLLRAGPFPLQAAQACEEVGGTAALEEALAGYERLGATRDAARVEAALRALGVRRGRRGPRARPRTGWDSLTPTELQVARLVAEGLTNREAGARLFVSPRTVETHLAHLYAKLGLSSRGELRAETVRRDGGARPAPTAGAAGPASR